MTKQIHNLIIVDASGSMSHKREDVVGGINSLFQKIKEDEIQNEVENLTTITDFSSFGDFRMILNQRKSNELKNLTLEDYVTRGSTALFDAIGQSFAKIPNEAKHVFVSIITDGMENDSREYSAHIIKQLIDAKEQLGWVVTFVGTTAEALNQARAIGVKEGKMKRYHNSKKGTQDVFDDIVGAKIMYSNAVVKDEAVEDMEFFTSTTAAN